MKTLNKEQVDILYEFTRKHYVEWYDLQTELVDHLAHGIEEQWAVNPQLDFEQALKNEFKKFGIYGFSDIVEQKSNALSKFYRKEVWKSFKNYFKLPKIIVTLFSIWALFKIFHTFENKNYILIPIVVGLFGFQLYHLINESRKQKKKKKATGKAWLFENVLNQMGGLIHLFNLGIYFPHIFDSNREWSLFGEIIFSTCVVLYFLMFYVAVNVVSPAIKEKFSKEYPEYKLI